MLKNKRYLCEKFDMLGVVHADQGEQCFCYVSKFPHSKVSVFSPFPITICHCCNTGTWLAHKEFVLLMIHQYCNVITQE